MNGGDKKEEGSTSSNRREGLRKAKGQFGREVFIRSNNLSESVLTGEASSTIGLEEDRRVNGEGGPVDNLRLILASFNLEDNSISGGGAGTEEIRKRISEIISGLKNLHISEAYTLPEERVVATTMEDKVISDKGGRDNAEKDGKRTSVKRNLLERFREKQKEKIKANMASAATASSSSSPSRKPGPASKTGYYAKDEGSESSDLPPIVSVSKMIRGRLENNKPFEPAPKVITRNEPKPGDFVFAMFKNLEHPWLIAEVLEIVENPYVEPKLEYVIHYEPTTKRGIPTGEAEVPGESYRKLVQVCLKMIAPPEPCPYQLPIGSRVIAKLMDEQDPSGQFYAGIIGDTSKMKDRPKHYLIFFDTGAAQYVHAEYVFLIRGSDTCVWNDCHPNSYDFIKEYIIKYPRWPLVKVHVGQIVATEWNGVWLPTRVRQVDGSLAYVQFEHNGTCDWIYRGSGRLRVVTPRLLENTRKKIAVGPELRGSSKKKSKGTSIYDIKEIYQEVLFFSGDSGAKGFSIELDDPTMCVEYQGRLQKINLPKDTPKQKPLAYHRCDKRCVISLETNEAVRKVSPLAIPSFFGWTRHKITEPTRHEIFYRAPCGVRLNDVKMLTKFLKKTQSNFTVDHFCFDYDVDCENEFVPARVLLSKADISDGLETVAVPLVNSIDKKTPPAFEYLKESVMGPGVIQNKDKHFLACCDCEDGDCSDQDKCACWQLTKKGVAFTKMSDAIYPTQGYENRRLRDGLASAIYECNEGCPCNKSCSNRVVQNGHQWPLQVYKTREKGWGVRTLFDIPMGAFVGYYVGEIFEFDYAENLDTGDEYFLALDYIETVGSAKVDYESDVTDIEADDEDEEDNSEEERTKKIEQHRKLYGPNEKVYTVDSKRKGNITRFMNHCCNPNLYPQNVFVDTHDMRFPLVALFTNMHIRAGSELTWDYNYTPGTVDGTTMHCKCMSYNCKGRLL